MIATFGTKRANFGHSDKKVGVCNCLTIMLGATSTAPPELPGFALPGSDCRAVPCFSVGEVSALSLPGGSFGVEGVDGGGIPAPSFLLLPLCCRGVILLEDLLPLAPQPHCQTARQRSFPPSHQRSAINLPTAPCVTAVSENKNNRSRHEWRSLRWVAAEAETLCCAHARSVVE